MKEYNIAISASKTYFPFLKSMLNSFCRTHIDTKINLYIFYLDPFINDQKEKFLEYANKDLTLNKIEFIYVEYSRLEIVDNNKGWAVDLWCRWYLLDYLVDFCDRVLVLGIDTMFQGNIDDFYFQDLKGYYFSCAPDMYINNSEPDLWPLISNDMVKFGLNDKSKYINGDVVLVNLKETSNNLSFLQFLKFFQINQFTCWDQDIISYIFNEKVKYQSYLIFNYFPNLNLPTINDKILAPNAKIIHFAGGPKPWNVPFLDSHNYYGILQWWTFYKNSSFKRFYFLLFFLNRCLNFALRLFSSFKRKFKF